jgi:hypothetical protein
MEKLGRFVRWFFGMQALLVLAIPYLAYTFARLFLIAGAHRPMARPVVAHALLTLAIYGAISITSALAWWALKKGWPSARIWALVASVSCLPSRHLSTLVGLAGLAVFWRKDVVRAMADSATRALHTEGDGTHKWIEKLAPLVMFALWFYARAKWAIWGNLHGLPPSQAPTLLLIVLAEQAAVILHEAGHLLAGWGSDMVLRGFQVGPVTGQVRGGRWRFAFSPYGFLGGGSVAMVPTHLRNIRGRKLLMILGGPVASLLTGCIGIALALSAAGSSWESAWVFLALFGTIGLFGFLFNLTPLRPEGAYSDGAQIYQIMSTGPWADRHLATAMVTSSLATSLRPREFDAAILERAANTTRRGLDGLHYRIYLAMHHLDSGRIDQGIAAWREAIDQDPEVAEKLSADTLAEFAFYEAAIANDLERAHHWWRRVELKGNSRKEVDYWKGRTAVLLAEGHLAEAAAAFHKANEFAQKLPEAGAYEYDRWGVDVLRRRLNSTDLERLSHSTTVSTTLQIPIPAIS